MRIIKLDAIDSTNTFLRELVVRMLEDYTVVVAKQQTKVVGKWERLESEAGKNLTFSVFKDVSVYNSTAVLY